MFKQTTLITWAPEATAEARDEILAWAEQAVRGASFSCFVPTVEGSHQGGDIVWHLHFSTQESWAMSGATEILDQLEAKTEVASLDSCAYATQRKGISAADLRNGIYRTLFVSVDQTAAADCVRQFADDLAAMPDYIPEILNWAMNPVAISRGRLVWSHVWEQEFADISGLVGPYMTSAYHWGYVDRWFDPEMPERIVKNGALCHSASILETSVISLYGLDPTTQSGGAFYQQ